jgi:hypothetical protein
MSRSAPEGWNKTIEDLANEMMRGERFGIDYDKVKSINFSLAYLLTTLSIDLVRI